MLLFCQILIKLDNSNCKLTRYFINIILHSIHKPQISILNPQTSILKPQISNLQPQILSRTLLMRVSMEFLYSVFISVV